MFQCKNQTIILSIDVNRINVLNRFMSFWKKKKNWTWLMFNLRNVKKKKKEILFLQQNIVLPPIYRRWNQILVFICYTIFIPFVNFRYFFFVLFTSNQMRPIFLWIKFNAVTPSLDGPAFFFFDATFIDTFIENETKIDHSIMAWLLVCV